MVHENAIDIRSIRVQTVIVAFAGSAFGAIGLAKSASREFDNLMDCFGVEICHSYSQG